MRWIFFILITLMALSCAKPSEEAINSAKQEALYYLTKNKCSDAKKALDSVDYQNNDATYLSLYASVYGCMAGYSELTTVLENLGSITSNATSMFQSLASMPAAQAETQSDSSVYLNLQKAINVLLYAGGGSTPSTVSRNSKFGLRKAGDIHIQAVFLILIQMGKYFAYYGNVDSNGTKGAGSGTWNCLAKYNDANALAALAINNLDSCTSAANTASPEMDPTETDYKRRLCEGVVLFNNFQDILSNITFPSNNADYGALTDIGQTLATIKQQAVLADNTIVDYENVRSQSACEQLAATQGAQLQRFFVLVLENFHF
jgi:hypothetical protein